jgi:polygalacturonase
MTPLHPRLALVSLLLATLFLVSCVSSSRVPVRYLITEHGAVGDGTTVSTKAIQATIDSCATAGGGVVVVPPGTFLSGALFFKAGVNLELQKDAVLKSTTVLADFPPVYTSWEGYERYWTAGFLNFVGMRDVVVSGGGTIDGSGLAWPGSARRPRTAGARPPAPVMPVPEPLPKPEDLYPWPLPTTATLNFAQNPAHLPMINVAGLWLPGGTSRLSPPRAVVFQDCAGVHISGVQLKNQARWGFTFIYCQDVVAENLTVHLDDYIPSSDGMDVCSCRNVRISGCDIACTDDDISIKSGKDADGLRLNRPSENITISNCTFGSGAGVAVGSEVSGSIRHVLVQHCSFTGSSSAARIKSQPSRGGVIEDIVYRDIQLANVGRAVEVDVEWRMVPPIVPPAAALTAVRSLRLINFTGTAKSVGIIHGFKDQPVRDVAFVNCKITAQRGLVLVNTEEPKFSGSELKVAEGEAIIRGPVGPPVQ